MIHTRENRWLTVVTEGTLVNYSLPKREELVPQVKTKVIPNALSALPYPGDISAWLSPGSGHCDGRKVILFFLVLLEEQGPLNVPVYRDACISDMTARLWRKPAYPGRLCTSFQGAGCSWRLHDRRCCGIRTRNRCTHGGHAFCFP